MAEKQEAVEESGSKSPSQPDEYPKPITDALPSEIPLAEANEPSKQEEASCQEADSSQKQEEEPGQAVEVAGASSLEEQVQQNIQEFFQNQRRSDTEEVQNVDNERNVIDLDSRVEGMSPTIFNNQLKALPANVVLETSSAEEEEESSSSSDEEEKSGKTVIEVEKSDDEESSSMSDDEETLGAKKRRLVRGKDKK